MIEKERIVKLTEEHLQDTNKYIVSLQVKNNNIINLYIDGDDSVTINDCVELSRHIESNLDRENEDFELNVSSAGLDQPFKVFRQYLKNINKDISVIKTDGQKLNGKLLEANKDGILIEIPANKKKNTEKKEIPIDFIDIKETKSIISFKK